MTSSTLAVGTHHLPADPAPAVRALTDAVELVHLPGTGTYEALTRTSNLTKATRPLAVVEARDAQEIGRTLRLAAAFGARVAVQGTGHGATERMEDAILVHTHLLDELTIHAEERWARIGAGVKWERVLEACAPHGLAGLCGSSPDVGVVGFLTGGGLGPIARSHGLSSDSVRAFEVVTGDGVLRRVTADSHPALFWGLRGGKGTLGIVTAVEIDLYDQPELYAGALWFDGADASAVVRTWSQWAEILPEEGTTSIAFMQLPDLPDFPEPLRGRTTVTVRFAWTGDPATGEEMLRAIRSVATPIIDAVQVMPYAALGAVHSDPVDPMPLHEQHYLLQEFDLHAADRLVDLCGPGSGSFQAMVEVRQLGGKVRDDRGTPSAFAHRDAAFSVLTIGLMIPEIAEPVLRDSDRIREGLAPWARDGGLPNFTDTNGRAWADRVYTPFVAKRLRAISQVYDPEAVLLAARGVRD